MGFLNNLAAVNRSWPFDFRGSPRWILSYGVKAAELVPQNGKLYQGVIDQLVRSCWCLKEKQGGITIKPIIHPCVIWSFRVVSAGSQTNP